MRVTLPVPITPSKLISSSASEIHAPAAYSSGTTYAFGEIVSVAADYKIYESLAASNIGHTPNSSPLWWRALGSTETAYNPATTYPLGATVSANQRIYESLAVNNTGNPVPILPETETAWWIDAGPTNKWGVFDLSSNTQTVCSSPLTVVFAPGERISALGITGMSANAIIISATSVFGGGNVYGPVIYDLNTRIVNDGYDYAFEPFSTITSKAVFNVPPFSDIIVTISLSSTSGNVKCGSVIAGTSTYLGDIQYQATNDGLNFSTVTRDLYGKATLIPRRTLPKTSQTLLVDKARVNRVKAARTFLNATPALWTGLDDSTSDWFEMLTILGIYTKFLITATEFGQAEITLELEEI